MQFCCGEGTERIGPHRRNCWTAQSTLHLSQWEGSNRGPKSSALWVFANIFSGNEWYLHFHFIKEGEDAGSWMSEAKPFLKPHFGNDGQDPGNGVKAQGQTGWALDTPDPPLMMQIMTQSGRLRSYEGKFCVVIKQFCSQDLEDFPIPWGVLP